MAVNIYWAGPPLKNTLGGPTPKKYSGRAHPEEPEKFSQLETLLDLRARALRALGDLLISLFFFHINPYAFLLRMHMSKT